MHSQQSERSERSDQRSKLSDASDMTPMVDVVFLLLIFFVVTASFQLQKSLAMESAATDAPSPTMTESPEQDSLQLQVDEDGTFTLITQAGQFETPSKQFLISRLKDAIIQIGDQAQLHVNVHEQAALQLLVDAMDAGTIAGFGQIQVTQIQQTL